MEEGKILLPQAFADILTSSIQNVIQGDQSSNKPVFLQEWPFFLHVCEKIGKKKRLRLHHTEHPFGPEYERSFSMKYDAKEFEKYPEIMNKEQMRIACHISKRTALYLLQFNLIPHTCTGKKTRCYSIKKSDVIAFMNDREVNPEKYIAPDNWYKYGNTTVKAYKIRIQPPVPEDKKKSRRFYESKLSSLPDAIDVKAAVDFTGYNRRTVAQWIRLGKLRAFVLPQKYVIPKSYLIDWLCSDEFNNTNRKSQKHIEMLWELHKWNDRRS